MKTLIIKFGEIGYIKPIELINDYETKNTFFKSVKIIYTWFSLGLRGQKTITYLNCGFSYKRIENN